MITQQLTALERQLIRHEGLELMPYTDTVGKRTIGVGHNLDDNGITEEAAMLLLRQDIAAHTAELERAFPVVANLDDARRQALINMAFNMGIPILSRFVGMWSAIEAGDYQAAADEMLDSKWARQVKGRAVELAGIMRTGELTD